MFREILEIVGIVAGIIGLPIAIVALLHPWWRARREDLEREINSPGFRSELIARHESDLSGRYYDWLDGLLNWTERVWGPRLSLRAFGTCLTLAFLYPIFAALIAWVISGQTVFGGMPLLETHKHWFDRFWRCALLLCVVPVGAFFFWLGSRFSAWIRIKLEERLGKLNLWHTVLMRLGQVLIRLIGLVVAAPCTLAFGFVAFSFAGTDALTSKTAGIYGAAFV